MAMADLEKTTPLINLDMAGTKWDFFVTAVDLFSARGYNNVSIQEIAATLGVKAASMYNHFSCKDDLLKKMYEFFVVNYDAAVPSLEQLLNLIPYATPEEIFNRLHLPLNDDPSHLMRKIVNIIIDERNRDERAQKLVNKVFMMAPRCTVKAILSKLIEQNIILPLDIDAFAELFTCLDFYASYTHGDHVTISVKELERCRKLLFSTLQVVK